MDAFIYSPLMHESYAGTVYDKLFHVTDWLPTLLELSGTPPPLSSPSPLPPPPPLPPSPPLPPLFPSPPPPLPMVVCLLQLGPPSLLG